MRQALRRTHATSLSDGELTLLDVIFCQRSVPRCTLLKKRIYGEWHRRHDLDDGQVDASLKKFVEAEMLTLVPPHPDGHSFEGEQCFAMTSPGGRVWESERLPDWSRFVSDDYDCAPTEKNTFTIISTSASACEDFWKIGWETGFFKDDFDPNPVPELGPFRTEIIRDFGLVPWKDFDRLHVLIGSLGESLASTERELSVDEILRLMAEAKAQRRERKQRRTWWRDSGELAKFWPIRD